MTGTAVELLPPKRSRQSRRWVLAVAVVVAAAVVAGGVLFWRWRNGATDLFTYGGITTTGPLAAGGTLYMNSDMQPRSSPAGHTTIDVRRVAPRITTNTAGATVQIKTCTVANPNLGMGFGYDTKPCAAVASFRSGKLDLGFPATELIYVLTARHAGTVRIEGADVEYSAHGRNGNQHAGTGILIHVRPRR